jgi:hypothetical protein
MHDARTKAVTGRWTSGGEQEHGTSGGELEQGTSSGEDEHGTSGDEQRGACGVAGTSSIGGMRGKQRQVRRWKKPSGGESDRSARLPDFGRGLAKPGHRKALKWLFTGKQLEIGLAIQPNMPLYMNV